MSTGLPSEHKKHSCKSYNSILPITLSQILLLSASGIVNGADQISAYLLGNNTLTRKEIQVPYLPKMTTPWKLTPGTPELWGVSWSHHRPQPTLTLCVMGSLEVWPKNSIIVTEQQKLPSDQYTFYQLEWRSNRGVSMFQGNLITGCGDLAGSSMTIKPFNSRHWTPFKVATNYELEKNITLLFRLSEKNEKTFDNRYQHLNNRTTELPAQQPPDEGSSHDDRLWDPRQPPSMNYYTSPLLSHLEITILPVILSPRFDDYPQLKAIFSDLNSQYSTWVQREDLIWLAKHYLLEESEFLTALSSYFKSLLYLRTSGRRNPKVQMMQLLRELFIASDQASFNQLLKGVTQIPHQPHTHPTMNQAVMSNGNSTQNREVPLSDKKSSEKQLPSHQPSDKKDTGSDRNQDKDGHEPPEQPTGYQSLANISEVKPHLSRKRKQESLDKEAQPEEKIRKLNQYEYFKIVEADLFPSRNDDSTGEDRITLTKAERGNALELLHSNLETHKILPLFIGATKISSERLSPWLHQLLLLITEALNRGKKEDKLHASFKEVLSNYDKYLPILVRTTLRTLFLNEDHQFTDFQQSLTEFWLDQTMVAQGVYYPWRKWVLSDENLSLALVNETRFLRYKKQGHWSSAKQSVKTKWKHFLKEKHHISEDQLLSDEWSQDFFPSKLLWDFIKHIEDAAVKYRDTVTDVKDIFSEDTLFRSSITPILFALFNKTSPVSPRELRIIEIWVDMAMTSNGHCLPWWKPEERNMVETSKAKTLLLPAYSQ